MLTEVKEGVRRAFRRFEPDDAETARFVDAMYARIKIDQAVDYPHARPDHGPRPEMAAVPRTRHNHARAETVPAEVLRENPDAILHGILMSVDHHVPLPGDPSEEAVRRNFGIMVIAIAPSAENRDAGITVLLGTAIKAVISGRAGTKH